MTSLFNTIRSAVTGGGVETAPYQVVNKYEGYEERLYPAKKWVKTQLQSMSRDQVTSPMFWKLFNYISGSNETGVKIPMTTPVTVLVEPSSGPACESTFSMAFYVPEAFQNETPQPTDPSVSIEERPELRVFARTFGGFAKERAIAEEHKKLLAALTEEQKAAVQPDSVFYYAGYDPPFKLFFRRNEILLVLRK